MDVPTIYYTKLRQNYTLQQLYTGSPWMEPRYSNVQTGTVQSSLAVVFSLEREREAACHRAPQSVGIKLLHHGVNGVWSI